MWCAVTLKCSLAFVGRWVSLLSKSIQRWINWSKDGSQTLLSSIKYLEKARKFHKEGRSCIMQSQMNFFQQLSIWISAVVKWHCNGCHCVLWGRRSSQWFSWGKGTSVHLPYVALPQPLWVCITGADSNSLYWAFRGRNNGMGSSGNICHLPPSWAWTTL